MALELGLADGPVLLEGDAETALAGVAPCPGAGHSAVRKRL